MATAVAMFKAMVCSGITFTPSATAKCGWVFAVVTFPTFAVLCVIGVQQCVHCLKLYDTHRTFADLANDAFGTKGRIAMNVAIVVTQSSFCSIYLLFVARSVPQLLGIPLSSPYSHAAQLTTLLCETAVFVPFSWMREIGALNVVNKMGTACILFGVVVMISVFGKSVLDNGLHPDVVMVDSARWPVFIGVAGYTFEGIAAIIPIYQALGDKNEWTLVLQSVIFFVVLLMTLVGVLGYMAYGPSISTVALESLPESPVKTVTSLIYCIALTCSLPLQFFPVPKIIEGAINFSTTGQVRLFRSCYIVALGMVAYLGRHDLGKMVQIVGSLFAVPLMIVAPSCIHLVLRGDTWYSITLDIVMIFIGTILTATCTITAFM